MTVGELLSVLHFDDIRIVDADGNEYEEDAAPTRKVTGIYPIVSDDIDYDWDERPVYRGTYVSCDITIE